MQPNLDYVHLPSQHISCKGAETVCRLGNNESVWGHHGSLLQRSHLRTQQPYSPTAIQPCSPTAIMQGHVLFEKLSWGVLGGSPGVASCQTDSNHAEAMCWFTGHAVKAELV